MDKGNTTRGLQQVQKAWQACVQSGGFDSALSSNLRIVSVSEEGEVICQFKVENDHLNVYNGLHGGYISTLIDIGGSLAITYKGGFASGVSTDLSVSFISTATAGDLITVRSRCDKLGKSMAYSTTEILKKNPKTQADELIACGRHTKFVLLSRQENDKLKSNL
ncbi:hypothetical protein DSO57_1012657 [Entomophthora muscae]|uniref:Uncharacterized protein n=1 Tax=Entomophthora muscae TaxID=34485 RepID=A0ACC2RX32_9FUNG|nr:hypothetical protein DSO57_1012657 [Entomophthora muscae]